MGVCTDCNEGGDGESNRGGAVRVKQCHKGVGHPRANCQPVVNNIITERKLCIGQRFHEHLTFDYTLYIVHDVHI